MRLLVLFNLKPGVSPEDYEHWAKTRDMPTVRSLPSIDDFRAYRVTGLLGIGYEIVVVRVIGEVAEDTVYTFAMLLAVYLVGSAAGAALYRRIATRWAERVDVLGQRLLVSLAVTCLIGAASLWAADHVHAAVITMLPPGMASALAAEAVLALMAFALPTVAMGATFSHLATEASRAGIGLGRALGLVAGGRLGEVHRRQSQRRVECVDELLNHPVEGENGHVPLYRDEAIVLRTHKLGEADRIVTMLTRGRGRVRAVGKGVRRTKSRFGARLEPFAHIDRYIPRRSVYAKLWDEVKAS
mgnify:CR=1 FL=1